MSAARKHVPLMKFRGRISRTYNRDRWTPTTKRPWENRWAYAKATGLRSERCRYMFPMYRLYVAFGAFRGDAYRAGDTERRPWRFAP